MSFNFKGDIPQGVNIEENAKFGEKLRRDSWTKTGAILDFYEHVKSGGLMDYKTKGSQYENFGNYNYGVVAQAMGVDKNFAKAAAGAQQARNIMLAGLKNGKKWFQKLKEKDREKYEKYFEIAVNIKNNNEKNYSVTLFQYFLDLGMKM